CQQPGTCFSRVASSTERLTTGQCGCRPARDRESRLAIRERAMFAFGLVVLSRAVQLSRGRQADRAPALVIGICYLTFGLVSFIGTGRNPHFLGFILIGALVTATALTGRTQ